jgi:hypothetical protein
MLDLIFRIIVTVMVEEWLVKDPACWLSMLVLVLLRGSPTSEKK